MVKLLCLKNISTVSNHRLSDQSWLCNYIQTSPFYFLGENAIFSNILTSLPWLIDSLQKSMRHASFYHPYFTGDTMTPGVDSHRQNRKPSDCKSKTQFSKAHQQK